MNRDVQNAWIVIKRPLGSVPVVNIPIIFIFIFIFTPPTKFIRSSANLLVAR